MDSTVEEFTHCYSCHDGTLLSGFARSAHPIG
jgi:hypothetical protein